MKHKNGMYNKTKKRALEVLKDGALMDGPTFARKVGIRPVRRVYAYLTHLATHGLVLRRSDVGSKLVFQITQRGLERLEWLHRQAKSTTIEELILPFLQSAGVLKKD